MKILIIAVALGGAVASAALVGAAGPARATYPGIANGRLAFGITLDGNTDVYSVMPNGAAFHRLTDDPASDICPAYSADGKWITWCGGIVVGPGTGTVEIWKMKHNGTQKQQVTHMGGFATFPDFSPDGSQIAFGGRPAGATTPDIYVVGTDGSNLRQLTTDPGVDQLPAWSPDGSKIVFISNRTGVQQVWVIDAHGGNQMQLTFDPILKDQLPEWSPDGSRIAFIKRTAPVCGDIWVVNADGSDPHALTSGPPDELGPAWSPDGAQIAYLNCNTRTVEVMNADGTDVHPVHLGGVQFVPAWQPRGTGTSDEAE